MLAFWFFGFYSGTGRKDRPDSDLFPILRDSHDKLPIGTAGQRVIRNYDVVLGLLQQQLVFIYLE